MRIEISFTVEWGQTYAEHRTFRKQFDVDWSGFPRPGDEIEVDARSPIEDTPEFRVKGLSWNVSGPVSAHLWLEPFSISLDQFEWQDGFDGYVEYMTRQGWR